MGSAFKIRMGIVLLWLKASVKMTDAQTVDKVRGFTPDFSLKNRPQTRIKSGFLRVFMV